MPFRVICRPVNHWIERLQAPDFPSPIFPRNFSGMARDLALDERIRLAVKPTGVASLTYVRNNHTFKLGSEWHIDGFINQNYFQTYGAYNFSNQQTTLPSTQGQSLGGGSIGHGYASFLLGGPSTATIANPQDPEYRRSAWALFIQDSWKVTRKLTLDYGLRWDYQTAMREIWDRTSGFDPSRPNPSAGGLLGATVYEGFDLAAIAPLQNVSLRDRPARGAAYQIDLEDGFRASIGSHTVN
jgi:hypothetical protein